MKKLTMVIDDRGMPISLYDRKTDVEKRYPPHGGTYITTRAVELDCNDNAKKAFVVVGLGNFEPDISELFLDERDAHNAAIAYAEMLLERTERYDNRITVKVVPLSIHYHAPVKGIDEIKREMTYLTNKGKWNVDDFLNFRELCETWAENI